MNEGSDFGRMDVKRLRRYLLGNPVLIDPHDLADEWVYINKDCERASRLQGQEDTYAINSDLAEILRGLSEHPIDVLLLNIMSVRAKCLLIPRQRKKEVIECVIVAIAERAANTLLGVPPVHRLHEQVPSLAKKPNPDLKLERKIRLILDPVNEKKRRAPKH